MQKLLLIGAVGAAVALGSANAYALPANSPYAIWLPQSVDSGVAPMVGEEPMREGRSAFVQGGPADLQTAPGYDYGATNVQTPEEQTYYSRGK